MKFQLRPILSEMKDFYSQPISEARFKAYLAKLQGDTKGDMTLPISGFNPMAKDHILKKIDELQKLNAESLMQQVISEFNSRTNTSEKDIFTIVLNLADDLKGRWTNHYVTDFESKFKLNAFIQRKFCVPYFWTSESYTAELIKTRTAEYINRTSYRTKHPQPTTLKDHLEQEIFVATKAKMTIDEKSVDKHSHLQSFYQENQESEDYGLIFNFFYGDSGSESLGYKSCGIYSSNGYEYAKILAKARQ